MSRRTPRYTLMPDPTLYRSAGQTDRAAPRAEREGEAAVAALDLLGHVDLTFGLVGEAAGGRAAGSEAGHAAHRADRGEAGVGALTHGEGGARRQTGEAAGEGDRRGADPAGQTDRAAARARRGGRADASDLVLPC